MAIVGLGDIVRDEAGNMVRYNGLIPPDDPKVQEANRAITALNDLEVTRAKDCWSEEVRGVRAKLAEGDKRLYKQLLEPKPHWHPKFRVKTVKTRGQVYRLLGQAMGRRMGKMAEGDGGTFTLACGPVRNFGYSAAEINRRGVALGDKIYFGAMDDWAVHQSDGELYFKPGEKGSFAQTFLDIFVNLIDKKLRPEESKMEWGVYESFLNRVEKQLEYEDRCINYGVGRAMHRAFFDPNHAKALMDVGIDPRDVVFLLGARVTEETITGQNDITGYPWGCPSEYANSIGPVLLNDVPTYGFGGCDGYYPSSGETWQGPAIQTVLAMPRPDVTAIASYLPCKPGVLYVMEDLLKPASGEVH